MIFFLLPLICNTLYVFDLKSKKVARNGQDDVLKLFLYPNEVPQVSTQKFWKCDSLFCPAEEEEVAVSASNSAAYASSMPPSDAAGSSSTEGKQPREVVIRIPKQWEKAPIIVRYNFDYASTQYIRNSIKEAVGKVCDETDFSNIIAEHSTGLLKILPKKYGQPFHAHLNEGWMLFTIWTSLPFLMEICHTARRKVPFLKGFAIRFIHLPLIDTLHMLRKLPSEKIDFCVEKDDRLEVLDSWKLRWDSPITVEEGLASFSQRISSLWNAKMPLWLAVTLKDSLTWSNERLFMKYPKLISGGIFPTFNVIAEDKLRQHGSVWSRLGMFVSKMVKNGEPSTVNYIQNIHYLRIVYFERKLLFGLEFGRFIWPAPSFSNEFTFDSKILDFVGFAFHHKIGTEIGANEIRFELLALFNWFLSSARSVFIYKQVGESSRVPFGEFTPDKKMEVLPKNHLNSIAKDISSHLAIFLSQKGSGALIVFQL